MSSTARLRILDTMTVSFLLKGDSGAIDRLQECSRTAVLVPQPVLAEIRYGLEKLPTSKRRSRLESRFELLLEQLVRAEWNDDVSHRFGILKSWLERRETRLEDFDIAIAAHAVSRGAILASSNSQHMERIPDLELEDWSG